MARIKKMDKVRLFVDELNNTKPIEIPSDFDKITFTQNKLIQKCLFIYFWLYGIPKDVVIDENPHECQFDCFCQMLSLCHYIFHDTNISIKFNKKIYPLIDLIYKNKQERLFCKMLFQKAKQEIKTFREMEFISFALFFSRMLKSMKFKKHDYVQTKNKILQLRARDVINKLNLKYDVDDMFETPVNVDIYSWFHGNFESGVENIFQGLIPEMSHTELFRVIKQLKKELK